MKPTTKLKGRDTTQVSHTLNLRISDDLNNNSVMIPSILNDSKEQSHRETPSVSGDSATQNSLEKGEQLFDILRFKKSIKFSNKESIKVALADQKKEMIKLFEANSVLTYNGRIREIREDIWKGLKG